MVYFYQLFRVYFLTSDIFEVFDYIPQLVVTKDHIQNDWDTMGPNIDSFIMKTEYRTCDTTTATVPHSVSTCEIHTSSEPVRSLLIG